MRRDRPGHSHRLLVVSVAGGTPIADAVGAYVDAMTADGFSRYTVAYRARSLNHLLVWLADIGIEDPLDVSRSILEAYKLSLALHRQVNGRPLSFRSQASYLVPVKSLFSWLATTERIRHNPAASLRLPRAEHRLPKAVLTAREVELVMAIPDLRSIIGLRDRAILEVLYSTGVRRSELCSLRVHDLDTDRGTVAVRQGKGRRDRVVPIGQRALGWVDRYLLKSRPQLSCPPDHDILFLTLAGNDLTPDHLTERVGRYVRQGCGKAGSCHSFRHSMATLMLEGGADIRHIQEILGHVQLSTTQIYTHVSVAQLQAVHARCHPAGDGTTRAECTYGSQLGQPERIAVTLADHPVSIPATGGHDPTRMSLVARGPSGEHVEVSLPVQRAREIAAAILAFEVHEALE